MTVSEFEMTDEDLAKLIEASQPVPMIMLQCGAPTNPQVSVNRAWQELGDRMGFDHMTACASRPGNPRFFYAEPK